MNHHRIAEAVVAAGAQLVALLLSAAVTAAAPADPKTPIYVSHTGTDAVGASFVEGMKAALTRAPTATLAASADDADVVLLVTTMNPDAAKPGTVTAAGWTLLLMKEGTRAYVGGGLRLCDPGNLQKSAGDLVAYVEGLLKARSAELPSSPEREKLESAWNDAVEQAAAKLPEESCGVRVRAAFREQMRTYLLWTTAGSLKADPQEAVAAATAYFTPDEEFAKKVRSAADKLGQCQAELAALKKAAAPVRK
jgi:hypothetical protein